jgi:hypothetical protein
MPIRTPSFIIIIFLLLLPASKIFAQQKIDTLVLKSNTPDTSGKNLLALDTAIKKKHNPKIATFRSAVLPGWGQAYNKKYWKIPIVYGALGTTAGVFLYNIKTYRLLRKAVIYRLDKDTSNDNLIAPEFAALSTESIRFYRNAYRQNIDYSVLVFLIFWGLNVVDATVDAHLKAFDVSPDIGMKVRPGFNHTTNGAGVSLVFFFKDKNSKPLLPLP